MAWKEGRSLFRSASASWEDGHGNRIEEALRWVLEYGATNSRQTMALNVRIGSTDR